MVWECDLSLSHPSPGLPCWGWRPVGPQPLDCVPSSRPLGQVQGLSGHQLPVVSVSWWGTISQPVSEGPAAGCTPGHPKVSLSSSVLAVHACVLSHFSCV